MANKEELKGKFVTGAIPTEQDFHDLIDLAGQPGPEGPPGKDGVGEPGPQGEPGKDGFGTESQYNDIISRLESLEANGEGE